MNKIANQFTSIEQVTERYLGNRSIDRSVAQKPGFSFEEILHQKQSQDVTEGSELKFSKHAAMRLEDRNINLSKEQSKALLNSYICPIQIHVLIFCLFKAE